MAPLFILYGSSTGNARAIAQELANQYTNTDGSNTSSTNSALPIPLSKEKKKTVKPLPSPFTRVICSDLDSFKKLGQPIWETPPSSSFSNCQHYGVLIITSTTGNGDAPENASKFARFIKKKVSDKDTLPFRHCAFSVLGLGDTNYDQFCAMAKLVDKKVHELGGTRIRTLVCADEATGLEEPVELWTESIVPDLAKACLVQEEEKELHDTNLINHECTLLEETALLHKEIAAVHLNPDLKQHLKIVSQEYEIMDTLPQEEEKKTDHNPSPSLSYIGNSQGVRHILQLLSSTVIPCVNEASLPTSLGSKLFYSCQFTLIENDEKQQEEDETNINISSPRRKSRGMSMAEADRMTISSGSTNTLHFTLAQPYDSTILQARYLTATPLTAAQASAQVLLNSDPSNNNKNTHLTWENELTQAKEVFESILVLDDTDPNTCSRNEKRVIELTLSLPDDYTLEYQPGDSIGILVPNTSFNISFILHMLKQHHNIHSTQLISIDSNQPISLEEAMRYHFDISSTIQNEMICFILAQHANDPMEKAALILLASNTQEGKSMYQRYVEEQRRSIVDLLHDFPSCRHISLSTFISLLPLAVPRYYSVCSSPLGGIMDDKVSGMTSQKLTIAFSVVDYIIPPTNTDITCTDKARRIGGVATRYLETICSPFLSQMYPHGTTDSGSPTWLSTIPKVKIFPRPTSEFLLPSDWSTPLILIGPGTGIAPFMGFLAHRRAQLLSSSTSEATVGTWRGDYEVEEEELISESNSADYFRQKLGDIDVFFGCRFQDHDWLYKEEMHQLQKEGIISKLNVCFSREKNGSRSNDEIKYVQDFLKAKSDCSKRLVRLMEQKGMIFICGDGNKMAKDVQNAIINVFAQEMFSDGLSVELTTEAVSQAKVFVDMLKAEGRFVMDIWS